MNKNCVVGYSYNGTWTNEQFKVKFEAISDYWYQPCVMYFKDGTGQPEDWGVEDIEVTIKSIKNKATGIIVTELLPSKVEDIKEKIAQWILRVSMR